ncbi:PRC-barrel domain-containing protein [Microlunatus sagamiharensis]|uniref:PRC-barrel domain-containing protein n=1 Tax=Microlunatus sagamiharensis TaxID=546874 RepID=A0A1H2NC13_9ACTN|nr:PRC-barrel domain-containing protein [Microlunatus sagamiharensis]SDV02711.1 PRC-barrel domain-containing protein [Microlunatus sagamiharensis]
MSISTDDLGRITQQTDVVSSDGDKLGSVHQVYTSDTTGDPAWVTVKTGLFGTQESFVPLSDSSFDGDDIRVGVTKQAVHDAPRVDTDGHLSPEEEDDLYRHYGLHNPDQGDARPGVADRRPDGDHDGDRDDRLGDDRPGDDQLGDDSSRDAAAAAGAGGVAGGALGDGVGRDRSEDDVTGTPRHAATDDRSTDDRSIAAENGPEHVEQTGHGEQTGPGERDEHGAEEAVKPGERTTRLRRYVVTERVVQTVEELPAEDDPSR